MSEEFNLKEKRETSRNGAYNVYPEEDVKEFIRLLKEEYKSRRPKAETWFLEIIIDKLAGEKLT